MPPQNNPSNGLPTGYTLDNSSASSASAGLPQGYALDATSNVPPGMEATGVPRAAGAPSSQPEMSQVGLLTGRPSEPITTKTPTQVVSQVGQNLGGMVDQISNSLHGRPNPPQQPLIDTSTPWSTVKDIMTAGPRSVYRQAAPIVQSMATPSPVPFLGNVATGALLNEASTTPEEGVNQPSINAAKAESQATLKRAIPPTKSAPYTDEQLSAAHPYIESEHAGSPIKSVEDLRDAQDAGVKKIEHTVSGYVAQNPNDLIQTHPGDAARAALAPTDKLRAGFLDQGMKELAPYHLDEPMTVAHADALRRQLNAENDAYAATNKYTYAQARATNPAFAAREAAVAALRDGVYKGLSDRGFADAAKLRNDEGALLATRNATQNQIFNGEKSVSGTGTNTPAGKMGQAAVRAATLGGGAGLGGYLGGVPGATAGGIIGGGLGEIINNVAFPGNMTRDALVESAFKNSPKSPLNTIRNAAAANTAPPLQITPPAGTTPAPVPGPLQPALAPPPPPATTAPAAPEVPGPLKSVLSEGGERRLAPRGNLSPKQIIEGIKQRGQGPQTVVQNTEGAADLIKRSGVNNRGESMVYSNAGGEPRVTTLGGLNGSAKIGELVGKDIGNGTIEVTSNQIYGKNLQGVGRGTDQINHFLQNMGPETKIVKSDISTSVGARGAWDNVMKSNPGAVTKQVFKDGQVQYTVDMSKFARNR